MNELDHHAFLEGKTTLTDIPHSSVLREQFLRWLRHVPHLGDTLKTFAPSDTFRVVMSSENAKFFKQAADGMYKPFLHDGKRFVENVDLLRMSPDYVGQASSILISLNMAAIAADLNTIKIGIRDLQALISNNVRGEVNGAVTALRQAKALTTAAERRRETLNGCRDLSIRLGALAGQLKTHCKAMPEPETGFFDGFFGSGLDDADAKWQEVACDLILLKDGLALVLQSYSDLGEPGAAREALRGILDGLRDANLADAARKARLVRISAGKLAPEDVIKRLTETTTNIHHRLLNNQDLRLLPIMLDIKLQELQSCPMPHNSAPAAAS